MAQTGFTPILCYASGTATNVPLAANLTSSASGAELALNYADGKLYFKNSSGVVTLLASSATVAPVTTLSFGTTGLTPSTATSGAITVAGTLATTNGGTGLTSFTANRVFYASSTSAISQSANLTFDGTTLVAANFTDSSLTSGRVTYATTGGNLTDSANLTFDGTNLTLGGGTANGVAYLNGSKVLTSGSALTFDGTRLGVGGNPASTGLDTGVTQAFIVAPNSNTGAAATFIADSVGRGVLVADQAKTTIASIAVGSSVVGIGSNSNTPVVFNVNASEQMRLTSTGLGIGTSSPGYKLDVNGGVRAIVANGTAAFLQSNASGSYTSLSLGRTSQEIFISVAGVANNFITGSAAGDLTINNNTGNVLITAGGSATQLYLNTSGNLGLGVTPSAWNTSGWRALEVGVAGNAFTSNAGNSSGITSNAVLTSAGWRYGVNGAANFLAVGNAGGSYAFFTAPSGTAGNAISFTQAMTLDASANLCIGTTNISDKVTVFGGVALQWDNDRKFWMSFDNTYRNGVRLDAATRTTTIFATGGSGDGGSITFNTRAATGSGPTDYGTERMRLDSSGNLGLGVTPSAWASGYKALQIGATGALWQSASGFTFLSDNAYVDSGAANRYITTNFATLYRQQSGQHNWFTAPSGTAGNAISFTQAMTLDASGNLGVGTTSPGVSLDVVSSSNAVGARIRARSGDDFGFLQFTNNAGSTEYAALSGSSGTLAFYTGASSTERARIDSSGNLLVGTTTTSSITQGCVLYGNTAAALDVGHATGTASGANYGIFRYNGSNIGSITQNGTTGVLYNITSDYRLKTLIAPVSGSGERIDALKPVEYEWKADGKRARGFFAHEFQAVYADSVSGTKDAVDEDGNPVYQQMQASTTEVIADLVAELQSLRRRVAQLEGK